VSVTCVTELWKCFNIWFLGIVKTNHARFPKQFIESTIKNWPARSHIVLEGSSEDGVDLLAIGYKYNTKKVLCFVSTKIVGSTEPACYYEACWMDPNGNMMSRRVPRPTTINEYFLHSNTVDKHNHVHQFLLWLEKHWKTEDGYFQIITTIFGICITDAWKAYQFHLGNWHHHKQITIDDFADLLCHDCLNNKFSDMTSEESALVIPSMPKVVTTQTSETQQSSKNSDKTSRILHRYIHVSDAPTAVSSLLHSRASGLHQSNVHDVIKVQANEKGSDPMKSLALQTK